MSKALIFEENETLDEYDNINYIKKTNGMKNYIKRLSDNIIETIYVFKRK